MPLQSIIFHLKLHWNGLYNKNARDMVLSLQACWNISSFKYTSRNDTEFSEGIYMVNDDKMGCVFPMGVVSLLPQAEFGANDHREHAQHFTNPKVSHLWIRARNNSAIPIMPVMDPDLASETKPISQYENFNYGGWVFKLILTWFLYILDHAGKAQQKIQCYLEVLSLIWAGTELQRTENRFRNRD